MKCTIYMEKGRIEEIMKKIINKKKIKTSLWFLIIDIILIGGWTIYFKPSSDMTIVLIYIIPAVFIFNLVCAITMYFIKKFYSPSFLINAVISPLIIYSFFGLYIKIHAYIYWDEWEFNINGITHILYYTTEKDKENRFYIYDTRAEELKRKYNSGAVIKRNDTIYFHTRDSTSYFIYNNYLYNFTGHEKLKVKKKY